MTVPRRPDQIYGCPPRCKGCGGAIDPDTALGDLGYCVACGEATQRAYLEDKQRQDRDGI
jgi:hypothetical protein